MPKIKWLEEPEPHDYDAAQQYLALLMPESSAKVKVIALRDAPMTAFKAKDISRASGAHLLGVKNSHVRRNIKKIEKGVKLSPILLVRGSAHLIVADGFHRVSSVYQLDEDALIPCKLV